jgi:hypothetical protein
MWMPRRKYSGTVVVVLADNNETGYAGIKFYRGSIIKRWYAGPNSVATAMLAKEHNF